MDNYLIRLFKSRKTILELLYDRGYTKSKSKHMTLEKFRECYESKTEEDIKNEMGFIIQGRKRKKDIPSLHNVLIHWHIPRKLGSQECTNLVSHLKEIDIFRAIVIIEETVTHCAKKTLKSLRCQKPEVYIDIFTTTETQFNISHHKWVPAHIICSRKEQNSVMKEYAVTKNQLPNIKTTDPMARYLGAIKGQLIMITRNSDTMTGQKTIAYRLVA